jgi:hypothetical protein
MNHPILQWHRVPITANPLKHGSLIKCVKNTLYVFSLALGPETDLEVEGKFVPFDSNLHFTKNEQVLDQ